MPRWWWALSGLMLSIGALPWALTVAGVDGAFFFAQLCHQMPDRTLHLHGEAMVVCSRCAGIYLGLMLGPGLALSSRLRAWLVDHGRLLVIATIVANIVDWTVSIFVPLSHVSRIGVGALFGAAATGFMLAALSQSASLTNAGVVSMRSAADT